MRKASVPMAAEPVDSLASGKPERMPTTRPDDQHDHGQGSQQDVSFLALQPTSLAGWAGRRPGCGLRPWSSTTKDVGANPHEGGMTERDTIPELPLKVASARTAADLQQCECGDD